MIPVIRTKKLLIQQIGDEVVIYDQENYESHCLTSFVASVWRFCDGKNTVEDIIRLLEPRLTISSNEDINANELVRQSLDEMEQKGLIKEYLPGSKTDSAFSRRKVLKTSVLVGGFAIGSMSPLIKTILAPEPAMASSNRWHNRGDDRSRDDRR